MTGHESLASAYLQRDLLSKPCVKLDGKPSGKHVVWSGPEIACSRCPIADDSGTDDDSADDDSSDDSGDDNGSDDDQGDSSDTDGDDD